MGVRKKKIKNHAQFSHHRLHVTYSCLPVKYVITAFANWRFERFKSQGSISQMAEHRFQTTYIIIPAYPTPSPNHLNMTLNLSLLTKSARKLLEHFACWTKTITLYCRLLSGV